MPRYLWFILAAIALIIGYNVYGRFVEKIFGPNPKKATPAHTLKDGVDFVAMPKWKLWLNPAFKYRRCRSCIRSYSRCTLWSYSFTVGCFRYHFRRCCS